MRGERGGEGKRVLKKDRYFRFSESLEVSRGVIQVEKCAKIEEYIAELEEYYENRWESLKNIKVKGR